MCLFEDTLRALYLIDNDFEHLPPEIGNLKNLQIVSTVLPEMEQAIFQLITLLLLHSFD